MPNKLFMHEDSSLKMATISQPRLANFRWRRRPHDLTLSIMFTNNNPPLAAKESAQGNTIKIIWTCRSRWQLKNASQAVKCQAKLFKSKTSQRPASGEEQWNFHTAERKSWKSQGKYIYIYNTYICIC